MAAETTGEPFRTPDIVPSVLQAMRDRADRPDGRTGPTSWTGDLPFGSDLAQPPEERPSSCMVPGDGVVARP